MVDPLPPGSCLNCGAALAEPCPRFCGACGQETNVKPPTLGEFLQQFGGAYFSTEGALWRTVKLLLLKFNANMKKSRLNKRAAIIWILVYMPEYIHCH